MKKKQFLTRLDHILQTTSSRLGLKRKMKQYHLWHQWESIVGPSLATHIEPAYWRGSILVLRTKNSAWVQELSFMKKELLAKIQAASPLFQVKDLRFEIGKLSSPRALTHEGVTSLSHEENEFIDQVTNELQDDELREAAKRAMQKSFSRKKSEEKK